MLRGSRAYGNSRGCFFIGGRVTGANRRGARKLQRPRAAMLLQSPPSAFRPHGRKFGAGAFLATQIECLIKDYILAFSTSGAHSVAPVVRVFEFVAGAAGAILTL